jgi:hypothetical protein
VTNDTNEDHMNESKTCRQCYGTGTVQYRDGQPPKPCPECAPGPVAEPLRFTRDGTVVQIGAFDKGERPIMRRPSVLRLVQSGHGYIVVDVPIEGVGIATVQAVAPVEFMRGALGKSVRITFEVLS